MSSTPHTEQQFEEAWEQYQDELHACPSPVRQELNESFAARVHAGQGRGTQSVGAQRIEHFRALLAKAERFPTGIQSDKDLWELPMKLRTEAHYLITAGTVDADFMAFLSREKAAGRTYDSELLARSVFSQAGVVAPPESLIFEISHDSGSGA